MIAAMLKAAPPAEDVPPAASERRDASLSLSSSADGNCEENGTQIRLFSIATLLDVPAMGLMELRVDAMAENMLCPVDPWDTSSATTFVLILKGAATRREDCPAALRCPTTWGVSTVMSL